MGGVVIAVRRYQPDGPLGAYWQEFGLDLAPTDRVLDALLAIKDTQDGTLTFRRSCGHGICGSDAIRINGRNALACQTLIRDLPSGRPITLEPLPGLPLIKDLVVDMEPFFANYRSLRPYLVPLEPEPIRERLQSPPAQARYAEGTKCILCAACTTSCPVFWADGNYVGPAGIVATHRFVFDDRDSLTSQRLAAMNGPGGVWRCRTVLNCLDACPREIAIPSLIAEVKRVTIRRRV